MKWFAYGTNMDEQLVRTTYPSARRHVLASLAGHSFRFHKSSPGGGKADCFPTGDPDDIVWGVLYELDPTDERAVDNANIAAGYLKQAVILTGPDGTTIEAIVYVAGPKAIDPNARPPLAKPPSFAPLVKTASPRPTLLPLPPSRPKTDTPKLQEKSSNIA